MVPDGASLGAAAGGGVQFLDKVVDVPVVFLGSLVGAMQFLDKAADVPVVLPPVRLQGLLPGRVLQLFVEQVFDQDGVTVLKAVEVPQLQFIIVGLEMHLIETVQKIVVAVLFVQFLDKVDDTPVIVQFFDKVAEVAVVQVLGAAAGAVLAVVEVTVIML